LGSTHRGRRRYRSSSLSDDLFSFVIVAKNMVKGLTGAAPAALFAAAPDTAAPLSVH
jgi:hypothetical protein